MDPPAGIPTRSASRRPIAAGLAVALAAAGCHGPSALPAPASGGSVEGAVAHSTGGAPDPGSAEPIRGRKSPPGAAAGAIAGPLTLERSIALALEGAPGLAAARERIAGAREALAAARAAFRPSLALETSYLRADAPSSYLFKTIDARSFLPGTDFNDPGAFSAWEAAATLRYNLYAGGLDTIGVERAREGVAMSRLTASAAENALVAAVIDAFYAALAADEAIGTADSSVTTVRAQLEKTRAEHEHGRALRSDVLSLEVRLAEAEETLARARNGAALARARLANALGLSAATEIQLEAPTPAALSLQADDFPGGDVPDLDRCLQRARARRPEALLARRAVRDAELALAAARRAKRPRADLFARLWRVDDDPALDDREDDWSLGVSLSWSPYEGGARAAERRRAEARLRAARQDEREALLGIELDVKRACLALDEARRRVTVSAAAVTQAEESLRLVRRQYEEGRAPITRYLEAESMRTAARMRRTDAVYDLARARADLERALGRFSPAEDLEP